MTTVRIPLLMDGSERGVLLFRHPGGFVGRSTVQFPRGRIRNRIEQLLRKGDPELSFIMLGGMNTNRPGRYLEAVQQVLAVVREEFPGFDYEPVPVISPRDDQGREVVY